ncbi:MAG: hypothetical protein PF542_04450 [Nanoarchaeota archaeon]|jgi:hypothetical protein|nr:hypothetical protein [Nanoarchaeota archaeon]
MRKVLTFLLVLTLFPVVLAVNLDVERTSSGETLIYGLNEPVSFDLEITNNGNTDTFSMYTFYGYGIEPREEFEIKKGETKELTISIAPRLDLIQKGKTAPIYYIQGSDNTKIEEKLSVNIIGLEDAFEVGSGSIDPDTQQLRIFIRNKVNFDFKDLEVKFSSPFFILEETMDLSPYSKKEFTIDIEKEDFDKLMAGFYTLNAKIAFENLKGEVEGKIEFIEKDDLSTQKRDYGFIVTTKVIEKVNKGNTMADTEITIKKNILSRLFTTYSSDPDQVERQGATVYYTWAEKLAPGENFEVIVKTNWLLPFLIIFFFVTLIYFFKKYSTQKVQVRKRVSFVKAKGGEFALKVTIIAQAREFVEKVKIIDRLPPLVKMYERFGGELPDKISKDKKRLEWDFEYLEAGESRAMSYIVYSKVGVLGRFALPGTICRFEQEGTPKQTASNKAFFLAEQKDKKYLQ